MADLQTQSTDIELRSPSTVLRLDRMGSMHQTRLSFMRVLLRKMAAENWNVTRRLWEVNSDGVGVAVYTAVGPLRTYSLVIFSNDLDPSKRSDRVIAEEWDATFTLADGIPSDADISRLKENVPLQEAGRISETELSLSRANRSVRLFDYVRQELAAGRQPLARELDKVGYLMRTTAVYGSGKFGALDRRFIADREEFASPFQTELMAVYMIRIFSVDIVEHLASADSPDTAVTLDKNLRRSLGIGNSTGLGMAPFIVNHPVLFHHWMIAREKALQEVRRVSRAKPESIELLKSLVQRQQSGIADWNSEHPLQLQKVAAFKSDLDLLKKRTDSYDLTSVELPWNGLYEWAEDNLSLEGQEYLVTLLTELYPELTDRYAGQMSADEDGCFTINGQQKISELTSIINTHYKFAIDVDFSDKSANARFWYASEEKLEPRVGERFEEPGAEREHPLAIARDIVKAYESLQSCDESPRDESMTVAEFLLKHPQHRHVVRRAQQIVKYPYAEIVDNLIADNMMPIDLLRCKLSFFGAVKFDPRSDRWVRINMFQHAPLPDELKNNYDDTWVFPPEPANWPHEKDPESE